jgi:hypothetical protein
MKSFALKLALGATMLSGAPLAQADIVTDWNQTAIKIALENPPPGLTGLRNLAIVHLAIHDAVNGIKPRYQPYLVKSRAPQGSSVDAAALAAVHASLVALYPTQKPVLDAAYDRDLAKLPEGEARAQGIAWGEKVAAELVQSRDKDGVDAKVDYVASGDPNAWRPTFPAFAPPLQPQFGSVRPFFVRSALQFDPGPPQGPQTELFVREFDEVKRLGGRNSTERTPDQTAVAIFWTAPSYVIFSSVARQLSEARKFDLHENARLFALLYGATTDAYISGWAVKYKYPTARPITLIREADRLGNPALKADPNWEPLLVTPAHPNYISGHSIFAGAAEKVLQGVFGTDTIPTVAVTYPTNAVTRRYGRISEITEENDNGRVWGGIHTRQTVGHGGADQGRKVGDFAVRSYLLGVDAAVASSQ